jgi:hypothetical protein
MTLRRRWRQFVYSLGGCRLPHLTRHATAVAVVDLQDGGTGVATKCPRREYQASQRRGSAFINAQRVRSFLSPAHTRLCVLFIMALLNSSSCRSPKKVIVVAAPLASVIPSTFDCVCMKEDQLVAQGRGLLHDGIISLQGRRPTVNVVLQQVVDDSTTSRSSAALLTMVLHCRTQDIGSVAAGTGYGDVDFSSKPTVPFDTVATIDPPPSRHYSTRYYLQGHVTRPFALVLVVASCLARYDAGGHCGKLSRASQQVRISHCHMPIDTRYETAVTWTRT